MCGYNYLQKKEKTAIFVHGYIRISTENAVKIRDKIEKSYIKNEVNFGIIIRDLLSPVWLHGPDYMRNMRK